MDNVNGFSLVKEVEKEKAKNKIGYWKAVGSTIFDDEFMREKWGAFVETQATDDYLRGALIDESLQVLTMIKAGVPIETIGQVVSQLGDSQMLIDNCLGRFVHPEILGMIKESMSNSKSL